MQQEVYLAMEKISSLFSNVVSIAMQKSKTNSADVEKSVNPTQPAASLLSNQLGDSLEKFCENP